MRFIWWFCAASFVWNACAFTLSYWTGSPIWMMVNLGGCGLSGLCWLDAERLWRRRMNRL